MELSIENIANHYANMRDQELIRVATQDARGLRPEVYSIIENEIKKRNLDINLLKGVEAQNKQYTLEEIKYFAEIIRELPCPLCNQSNEKLNATTLYTVKSFIFLTTSEKLSIIGCPTCLNKENKKAIISTLLLGWWGIPWGIFKTVQYVVYNFEAKSLNNSENPNNIMLSIVLSNIGAFETFIDNKDKLFQFIKNQNMSNETFLIK